MRSASSWRSVARSAGLLTSYPGHVLRQRPRPLLRVVVVGARRRRRVFKKKQLQPAVYKFPPPAAERATSTAYPLPPLFLSLLCFFACLFLFNLFFSVLFCSVRANGLYNPLRATHPILIHGT